MLPKINSLFEQKLNGVLCDIKISLGGSFVMGHACVLLSCSDYFSQLLQSSWVDDLSWDDHWCPKRPLIVDLDNSLTDSKDKCLLCVSNIIDFMYTKEIVVSKGHSEHFSNIVNFLGVVDLFSFCRKFISDVQAEISSKNPEKNTFKTGIGTGLSNEVIGVGETKVVSDNYTPMNLQQCPQKLSQCLKNLNSEKCNISKKCNGVELRKKEDDLNVDIKSVNSINEVAKNNILKDTKSETHETQSCEFPCCKIIEDPPNTIGNQHKRKMLCEICSHSATSVPKMVEHITKSNHFGTICPICRVGTESFKGLQDHLKDHLHKKPYLCPICKKRNVFWEYHMLHLKVHCRNKMFSCEICKKRFQRQENLTKHLKSHHKTYVCNICNCPMSSVDALKSHLFEHEKNIKRKFEEIQENDKVDDNDSGSSTKNLLLSRKEFICKICDKGFTEKKNLLRHSQLIHFSTLSYNCSKCSYKTKRSDQLKHHMSKRHGSSLNEINEITQTGKKKKSKTSKNDETKIIGLMIPIKLVSKDEEPTTLDAFAVKEIARDKLKNDETSIHKLGLDENKINNSRVTEVEQGNNGFEYAKSVSRPTINVVNAVPSSVVNCTGEQENSFSATAIRDQCSSKEVENNSHVESFESNLPPKNVFDNGSSPLTETAYNAIADSESISTINLHYNIIETMNYHSNTVTNEKSNLMLNEATGEFLCNVQVLDTSYTGSSSETTDPSIHGLIFSSNSNGISIYDFEKDIDQFQSNPQTPSANVVELEDSDNLFSWNCLDNSFCSTWVLNEATGELNMVSFIVQPHKHSDESQLDENTGMFLSKDDDETALFLNEGTGDLSVIYFNPKHSLVEQHNQENSEACDNISEHSNDDEDLLNEEFFKATASFMAHEENEIFLNELTGEFNIAHFESQQHGIFESQITGSESYLNEETGEISWNVLNKNLEKGFFTDSENFQYGFDDSLNCDDMDPFPDQINDVTSHFHLDNKHPSDWQTVEDACDTLLNECTGELMKKS